MNVHQKRKDSIRDSMVKIQKAIDRQKELIALLTMVLSGVDKINGKKVKKENED